jgi:hypothetical protein
MIFWIENIRKNKEFVGCEKSGKNPFFCLKRLEMTKDFVGGENLKMVKWNRDVN